MNHVQVVGLYSDVRANPVAVSGAYRNRPPVGASRHFRQNGVVLGLHSDLARVGRQHFVTLVCQKIAYVVRNQRAGCGRKRRQAFDRREHVRHPQTRQLPGKSANQAPILFDTCAEHPDEFADLPVKERRDLLDQQITESVAEQAGTVLSDQIVDATEPRESAISCRVEQPALREDPPQRRMDGAIHGPPGVNRIASPRQFIREAHVCHQGTAECAAQQNKPEYRGILAGSRLKWVVGSNDGKSRRPGGRLRCVARHVVVSEWSATQTGTVPTVDRRRSLLSTLSLRPEEPTNLKVTGRAAGTHQRMLFPCSATTCRIASQKSGRSSGLRLETKWRSTTTAASTQTAPALTRSSLIPSEPVTRTPL